VKSDQSKSSLLIAFLAAKIIVRHWQSFW